MSIQNQTDGDVATIIGSLESEISVLRDANEESLRTQWDGFKSQYALALQLAQNPPPRDQTVYKANQLDQYGQDFLGYIDPHFVRDIDDNLAWYLSN